MKHSSICTRSIAAIVALSFAALAVQNASAQTTATTIPVGFITKTIPAAPDAATPSNTTLSIPLFQTADFQSSVVSTPAPGSNVIGLTSAAFTLNQFTTTPHLLRVKTGTLTGKFWTIALHDATTVTVNEPNGGAAGNLTGLLAGDSCEILPANTFGSTFANIAGLGTGTSVNGAGVDNILVWNGTSFVAYFYHSTNNRWQRGISNATNDILFPDDTVFFIRKVTSSLPITLMGTVPSTAERTELIGSSNNFIANRFPTDSTLGATGLENTTGWVKGTSVNGVDNVLLWNGASFDAYFYHSTNNRWQKGISNATAAPISAATGFFVVRSAGTTDSVLTQNLPYTP